jgi:hypothetical protein
VDNQLVTKTGHDLWQAGLGIIPAGFLLRLPGMHGRAVDTVNDQPGMHGRAVDTVNDQPGMHGRAVDTVNDQFLKKGNIYYLSI